MVAVKAQHGGGHPVWGWEVGNVVDFDPKGCDGAHIDPLLPWVQFNRKYHLTAGLNFYSTDPHVLQPLLA